MILKLEISEFKFRACVEREASTLMPHPSYSCGGAVVSTLVHSSPDRAVRVRALIGDTVLCSWARHFTLTVPANCSGNLTNCGE